MVKKYGFLVLFVFVLLLCNVSAITSDIKDKYRPGESVIVKLTGNILEPIVKEQVEFRKTQQINVIVPIYYDIKRLGEDYYIWFMAPADTENMSYTLVVKSIVTTNLGQTTKIDFQENFSVEGNIIDYNIVPGFVFTREDFSVTVNLNQDEDKTITVDFPNTREVVLQPGQNKIDFSTKDVKFTTLKNIKIGNYNFLAYITRNKTEETKKNNTLSVSPSNIDSVKLISDKGIKYNLEIENNGGNRVQDIYLSYDKTLFKIDFDKKFTLEPDESKEIQIEILSTKKNISEEISVKSDVNNISNSINVDLRFIESYSIVNITRTNNSDDNVTLGYYCAELGGKVCSSTESCTTALENSLDGKCCLGVCKSAEKPTNAWVGYVLVLIALGIIGYVYWNYRRVKANKSLLEKNYRRR